MRTLVGEALEVLKLQPSELGIFLKASPDAAWQLDTAKWADSGFRLNEPTETRLEVSIHAVAEHDPYDDFACDVYVTGEEAEGARDLGYCMEVRREPVGKSWSVVYLLSEELQVIDQSGWMTVCALRDPNWHPLTPVESGPLELLLAQYFKNAMPSLAVEEVKVVHADTGNWPTTSRHEVAGSYGLWHPRNQAFVSSYEFAWSEELPRLTDHSRPLLLCFIDLEFRFNYPTKAVVCWSEGDTIQRMFTVTFVRSKDGFEIIDHREHSSQSSNA